MNTSRLFHFLFQGNLVKRIAIGLVLGILVALVNENVKNSAGIDLASSFGVLGQIFVKALRAVAPILIFFLVMAALANKKVGSKSNMKEIVVLYLVGTFLACCCGSGKYGIPIRCSACGKRRCELCASIYWPSDACFSIERG